ncbi:MAG: SDR family oxidoreductase [Chloroflexota bacterium]|nr:SDR family oxidoreductase [Chloroflexota bacterium]
MRGKRVLITGATNGIGKFAALELAKMGANVVIVGRNEAKTRAVLSQLIADSGNDNLHMLLADLSSMAGVRRIADEFRGKYDRMDVLLNNAGAVFSEFQASVDGYEMTFALNHLSYYLLALLLLDTLKDTAREHGEARVINVSSSAHRNASLRLDNLRDHTGHSMMNSYGASKLMNVLFTYELARRLQGAGVTVNAVHPGLVATGFGHNMRGIWVPIIKILQRLFAISPEKGADTLVYLASSTDAAGITGKYWDRKQQKETSANSYDRELQKQLWQFSAEATGIG